MSKFHIEEAPFTCYFRKKAKADDLAFITVWLDVVFDFTGTVSLRRQEEVVTEEKTTSCHEIRVEVDIMQCDYRRLK